MERGDQNRERIRFIKDQDLVDYLATLGFQPDKIRGNDYWYLSPVREEKTASFKINRKLNRWYDHGLGKGGSIIDFGMQYFNCTVAEFLGKIDDLLPVPNHTESRDFSFHQESKIQVTGTYQLSSFRLIQYLKQRHIPVAIAERFCSEVRYEVNGKSYYAIGFKNDSGGYELRNPFFKGSSSPKDITTLSADNNKAAVFEGFIDFLSFIAIQQNKIIQSDFVILNSVALFERARPFLEQHEQINLYLDRDTTGQNCSAHALSSSNKYKDESRLYEGFKDINEWMVRTPMDKRQKKAHRIR